MNNLNKVVYPKLSYRINGILFQVQNELGRYKNEKQYSDAIEFKLKEQNISYEREKILPISFQGERKGRNTVDFLIEDKIVVETKAKLIIERSDYYQTQRYLTSLNVKLGILVNFRDRYLKPRRVLNSSISE